MGYAFSTRSAISEIVNAETEYLRPGRVTISRERRSSRAASERETRRSACGSEQQKNEEEGLQSTLEGLLKMFDLLGKGSVTAIRFTDARRAVLLLSSTRKLQTSAHLLQEGTGRTHQKAGKARRPAEARSP